MVRPWIRRLRRPRPRVTAWPTTVGKGKGRRLAKLSAPRTESHQPKKYEESREGRFRTGRFEEALVTKRFALADPISGRSARQLLADALAATDDPARPRMQPIRKVQIVPAA